MNISLRHSLRGILTGAAAAGLLLAGSTSTWAQQGASNAGKDIVGVWRLVSETNTKDGVVTKDGAFGANPKGMFIFTASGYYTSVNSRADLPKFASGNRSQGTPEENRAIVRGSIAHFGTYQVSPDGKLLTLKTEGGTWPAWTGTEQKRELALAGDELKYKVKASIGGVGELTYKRVK